MIALLLALAVDMTQVDRVLARYERNEAARLVPLLQEAIRFPTYAGNAEAHAAQKAWLTATARELGFAVRDAGKITEIELAGPAGAPVLGLVIHGDVQPVDAESWTFPPFAGEVRDGFVLGRGAADDKGPLVQALLAMKALAASGVERTHAIRLLVGSEEESSAAEMPEYLQTHGAPDYSLVLDSNFPVVVGEKAWDGFGVATALAERPGRALPYEVAAIDAGLAPSIVPDRAEVKLRWRAAAADWAPLREALAGFAMPEGTRLVTGEQDGLLRIVAYGKSAHSGVNITGGRNALVALARALEGRLPAGGADDLLAFARLAGEDLRGTGLGLAADDPVWGHYDVNVATLKPVGEDDPRVMLYVNLRRIPPRSGAQSRAHLEAQLAEFNRRQGSALAVVGDQSYFEDEPKAFDTRAKLVRRLLAVYQRATGERAKPAISGGGTYAKRLPNAIAFGMWFPGKPYPGHDLDEKIPIADLERGARVLVHALVDLATAERIVAPLEP